MAYLCNGYKNYSRFYRDHDTFDYMGNHLLFRLAKEKVHIESQSIKVWCCGCSGGEEPYTVLMLWHCDLAPIFPSVQLDLLATDISASAIATAKKGQYTLHAIVEMPIDWVQRYFIIDQDTSSHASVEPEVANNATQPSTTQDTVAAKESDKGAKTRSRPKSIQSSPSYTVIPQIRNAVQFVQQDAEVEVPRQRFDVILARYSVFLYCSSAKAWCVLQQMVHQCLNLNGYLIIGGKDNLPAQWSSLPLEKCTTSGGFQHGIHVYQKKGPVPPSLSSKEGDSQGMSQTSTAVDADAPPVANAPCTKKDVCQGACKYTTLDDFLIKRFHLPAKYTTTKRRLVFQMNEAYSTLNEEKCKWSAAEMEEFVRRMEQSTTLIRSKLHQARVEQLKTEMSEFARYQAPALTAEGLQLFLEKVQAYETKSKDKQEQLRRQLLRAEIGHRKRKRLSKKRMKKFLARMAAQAERRRSRNQQVDEAKPISSRRRSEPKKTTPPSSRLPLSSGTSGEDDCESSPASDDTGDDIHSDEDDDDDDESNSGQSEVEKLTDCLALPRSPAGECPTATECLELIDGHAAGVAPSCNVVRGPSPIYSESVGFKAEQNAEDSNFTVLEAGAINCPSGPMPPFWGAAAIVLRSRRQSSTQSQVEPTATQRGRPGDSRARTGFPPPPMRANQMKMCTSRSLEPPLMRQVPILAPLAQNNPSLPSFPAAGPAWPRSRSLSRGRCALKQEITFQLPADGSGAPWQTSTWKTATDAPSAGIPDHPRHFSHLPPLLDSKAWPAKQVAARRTQRDSAPSFVVLGMGLCGAL